MMTLENAKKLKEKILKADYEYYVLGKPSLSDAEYDRLYEIYERCENEYPELKDIKSPTQRVGGEPLEKFEKTTHRMPLLSIEQKAKTVEAITKFYNDCGGNGTAIIIQPKYDGITINATYQNGEFIEGATRGNGYIGEIISENVKTIRSVPMEIAHKGVAEVRGEAVISLDKFTDSFSEEYSNPRNFISGTMRQLDSKITAERKPDVVFYDIGVCDKEFTTNTDSERLRWLKEQGFKVSPYIIVNNLNDLIEECTTGMSGLIKVKNGFNTLINDGSFDCDVNDIVCDGLVLKVDNLTLREELGMTAKGPKWAFAYKFKSIQEKTTLTNVTWQVGRTGRLTPVANFETVNIGGTKISNATLNNIDYIKTLKLNLCDFRLCNDKKEDCTSPTHILIEDELFSALNVFKIKMFSYTNSFDIENISYFSIHSASKNKDVYIEVKDEEVKKAILKIFEITYKEKFTINDKINSENTMLSIGDEIIIERSNDVIPRIIGLTLRNKHISNEIISAPEYCPVCGSKVKESYPLHFCPNIQCFARIKGTINHFVSRDAMNIVGLGDAITETLIEKGFLKNIFDIYNLKSRKEELVNLEGFGKKKVENLLNAIEKSKEQPSFNFLYSLGIEGVGKTMSKTLIKHFGSLEKVVEATKEELLNVEDVGEVVADNIINYFNTDSNIYLINALKNIGISAKTITNSNSSDKFVGKTFVITGTLKEKRKYYEEIIEQNGGKCSGSVSAKTFAVVIGEDAGSKETKAKELVNKGEKIHLIYGHDEFEKFIKE